MFANFIKSLRSNKIKYPILFLSIFFTQTGCVSYLYQAAKGQCEILSDNIPIKAILKNPKKYNFSELELKKLRDVVQVKKFAERELGLVSTDNYTKFKKLKNKYPAYQVSASEALRFKAYQWYFPIVGRVPYLGYFEKGEQVNKADELRKKGLDVRLQNIIAYSTLGWFDDPLLSSMLLLTREDLINTLIHEMAHAAIYFPGDTEFNESVATFLGDEGTKLYLNKYLGKDNPLSKRIRDQKFDEKIFADHIKKLIPRLEKLYSSDLTKKDKLHKKKEIIAQSRKEFKSVSRRLRTKRYYFFFSPKFHPNNAHFLAYKRYFLDQSIFNRGYALFNNDYKSYLKFLNSLSKKGDKNYKSILEHELEKL